MKNLFIKITSLALFAQLLVVISADRNANNSKMLKNNVRSNKSATSKVSCSGDQCLCKDYFDIVLAIENSSFAGEENWLQNIKGFVGSLASKFKIADDRVHMGVILYASYPEEFISFKDEESHDEAKLLAKIDGITEVGKTHNVLYVDALYYALEDMLFEEGSRPDVPKATILFSYGYDNEKNKIMIEDVAEAYKEEGAKLIVVGMDIGENENMYLLAGCANNDKDCATAIVVEESQLYSAGREAKTKLCKTSKQ